MRLKKGSNVEVFRDGLWRPAQILRGNGHTYSVQCDTAAKEVEKIPRKWIRPCPPLKKKLINWKSGDVAEVLIHGAWRNATVTGIAYGNEFIFVNLLDISREISVKTNNVRLRHAWQNNKWVTIKKDSQPKEMKRKLDDSTVSSSGSCSTSGGHGNYPSFNWADDDAASSCEPIKEKKNRVHKSELIAYEAALSAFYKNGSVSWEQEAILADMRVYLNISLDEHWSVLRSVRPFMK